MFISLTMFLGCSMLGSEDFIPPVILASQHRLRLCSMDLNTDSGGTDPLRFGREIVPDFWMDLKLTDCSST